MLSANFFYKGAIHGKNIGSLATPDWTSAEGNDVHPYILSQVSLLNEGATFKKSKVPVSAKAESTNVATNGE